MIRKLLKSLREYKKPTLLTIFCAAIEVVFVCLICWILVSKVER